LLQPFPERGNKFLRSARSPWGPKKGRISSIVEFKEKKRKTEERGNAELTHRRKYAHRRREKL